MVSSGHRLMLDQAVVARTIEAVKAQGLDFVMEPEAREILLAYGIPVAAGRFCTTPGEASAAAREVGYPVALKVVSPQVLHKTEMGGVKLSLASDEAVREAYAAIMAAVGTRVQKEAIRGVMVERMARGHEVIIGASRDPQFGPVMMFGLGGIFVEILKDVSYRLAPLSPWEAREMVREVKGYPILAGARGGQPVDEEALADVLVRVSYLVDGFREIRELDLNPAFVEGSRIQVADARIMIG